LAKKGPKGEPSQRDKIIEALRKAEKEEDHETLARCRRRLTGGQDLPVGGKHIWTWFCELSSSRSSGMSANPLSFLEIEAWCRLVGVRPNPTEIRLIKALDASWLAIQHEKIDEDATPLKADGTIDYDAIEDRFMAAMTPDTQP
jgi:hypothetical protein